MMYLEQEKPYRPLLTALIFAALPLALLIHDVFAMIAGGGGLLFSRQDGGWFVEKGWNDSAVWLVVGVFFFFNLLIAAVLVKAALKKMLRRYTRHALFLAGVAACAAAAVCLMLEAVLGSTALGGIRNGGVLCYTVGVWVIAMMTLPKQLTRAIVQPITFYPRKR